jgi:hypothetical protein
MHPDNNESHFSGSFSFPVSGVSAGEQQPLNSFEVSTKLFALTTLTEKTSN